MIEENKHKGFNNQGHLDENSVAECAEWLNDGTKKLDPGLQDHLEKCHQCKAEVLEVSEIIADKGKETGSSRELFDETCAAKYSPSIKPAQKIRFWQAAAVILVLVSITIFSLLVRQDSADNEFADKKLEESAQEKPWQEAADSTISDEEDSPEDDLELPAMQREKYAANFIPNEGLEALIGVKYRGTNEPELTTPSADTILTQGKLEFMGRNPVSEKLELQLLNNRGEIIKIYPDIIDLELSIDLPSEPGLYYWKLTGEQELYFVGKVTKK